MMSILNKESKTGEKIGYALMYIVFTTILFFILNLLNRYPEDWTYFNAYGISLVIIIIGRSIRNYLE